MKLLNKIGLFVVFILTLSQAIGNSTFRFEDKLVVIENNENRSPSNTYFSLDFDEIEDENSVKPTVFCSCLLILEQRIAGNDYQFDTSFNFTFWQPPKIS
jgi:hypothetical protein